MHLRLCAAAILIAALIAPAPLTAAQRLRVVTYNVHHGTSYNTNGGPGTYVAGEQAALIASLDPDIVALQEVERFTGYGNEDQAAIFKTALERQTGVTWHAAFVGKSGRSWSTGEQGTLTLSRFPFTRSEAKSMPYGGGALYTTVCVGGRSILFTNVHLAPYTDKANQRVTQMAEIAYWLTVFGTKDRVILGDFNSEENTPELDPMRHWYHDMWNEAEKSRLSLGPESTRVDATKNRIDYVFFGKSLRTYMKLIAAEVITSLLSDHRPLVVEWSVS